MICASPSGLFVDYVCLSLKTPRSISLTLPLITPNPSNKHEEQLAKLLQVAAHAYWYCCGWP